MTEQEIIVELTERFLKADINYNRAYKWWLEEKENVKEAKKQRDELSREVASLTNELNSLKKPKK